MSWLAFFLSLSVTATGVNKPLDNTRGIQPTAAFTPAEKTISYKLGDRNISFRLIQYGPASDICCINLHDDEVTAVNAARAILEQRGGTIVKIENNAQRMVRFKFKGLLYCFDPNRIFSLVGINSTLTANGRINPLAITEVQKFATALLDMIPDSISCLIALHNNSNGSFSVKTYEPGGKRETDAKQVYADNWQDADDIALTTDETLFNKMSSFGYNSILQDNINVNKDGSLSVYYGERNRRYINIETQHGKTAQYKEMLGKLLYILDEEKRPELVQVKPEIED
jgi:hypothetical protein